MIIPGRGASDINIFRSYKKLLLIQIVAAATALLGMFVDGIVVSRFLGTTDMAAFGFAQPTVLICAAIGLIFSTGTQAIAGKCLGRGDIEGVNVVASLSLLLCVVLGAVLFFVVFFLSTPIVRLFGASGELVAPASVYLKGIAPGIILLLLGPIMTCLMQIDGDPIRSFASVAVMTAINIALDLLSALVLHAGMLGMALATTISSVANIAVMALHFTKKDILLHPSLKKASFAVAGRLIVTGLPNANQQFCNVVRIVVLNLLLDALAGSAAVAAFASLSGAIPLVMAVLNGFGTTTLLISGVLVGEEDRESFVRLLRKIFRLAAAVSLLLGLVVFVCAGAIASFYVSGEDAAQLAMVTRAFRLYAWSIPLTMCTLLLTNSYQSLGRSRLAILLSVLENAVLIVAFSFAISRFAGADGVWLSFLCTEALLLLALLSATLCRGRGLPFAERILLLPDGFGGNAAMRMNLTVRTKEEASAVAETVTAFCTERGIDRKRAFYSGLCMEEMTVIALENNAQAQHPVQVDIFLAIRDGVLTIHLKDNGVPFDPAAQNQLLNPSDPAANVAIRLFYHLVRESDYHLLFQMNMLTFSI